MYVAGSLPTDCGALPSPDNGGVQLMNGTTLGSVVKYFCNPGYTVSSPIPRVCAELSVWSGFAPVCINRKSLIEQIYVHDIYLY